MLNTTQRKPHVVGTAWREKFLAALARVPVVTQAARAAGVDRATAYQHRLRDKEFAEQWDNAIEMGIDALEQTAYIVAMGHRGDPEKGIPPKDPSEPMLRFFLSRRRRRDYGDHQSVELTGANGGPIAHVEEEFTDAHRLAALERIHARVGARNGAPNPDGAPTADGSVLDGSDAASPAGGEASGPVAASGVEFEPYEADVTLLAPGGEIDGGGSFHGEHADL